MYPNHQQSWRLHNESHLLPAAWSLILTDSTGKQNASRALDGRRNAEFLRCASDYMQHDPAHDDT